MAIVIIVLAAKIKMSDVYKNADSNVTKIGRAAFYLMIIFACGAILITFLGAIVAWKNKCCLVCCVSYNKVMREFIKIYFNWA